MKKRTILIAGVALVFVCIIGCCGAGIIPPVISEWNRTAGISDLATRINAMDGARVGTEIVDRFLGASQPTDAE